jgi:hypothetical protein
MDAASIAETAPREPSDTVRIWTAIQSIVFVKLRSLRLSGWEMLAEGLANFLSNHSNSLVEVTIENCILHGSWQPVLSTLDSSTSLRRLILDQIGQSFYRIMFPSTSEAGSMDVDDNDWQIVGRSIHVASILPHEDWNSKLESIMDDMVVSEKLIDPEALDADIWLWD